MRTTVTIDDDIATLLKREMRRSGEPFKQAVNHYLRVGLASAQPRRKPKPFKVTPIDVQLPEGINLNKTSEILEALEGPLYR